MNVNEDKIRAMVAEQAGEWFVANDDGPLDTREASALVDWFKASPVHIEEFLGVAAVARDLRLAQGNPEYSVEAIVARARDESGHVTESPWPRLVDAVGAGRPRRWFPAALAMACTLVFAVVLALWTLRPGGRPAPAEPGTAYQFATRHGEQLTRRLPDGSMLHLDTDSSLSIRYGKGGRSAVLSSGQVAFNVVHDPQRPFTVRAGGAEVVDLGTSFDVRLDGSSTVVTVMQGQVAVRPTTQRPGATGEFVELHANEQLRVVKGTWPVTPQAVDAERATAWLHRQIAFDHQPLEQVAAEFNRYTATPIEIVDPTLRQMQISGVFATDDTNGFVAFLRSLDGVRVDVTGTSIRVTRE